MIDLLDSSQIRQIAVTISSAILAFATPTEGFVLALVNAILEMLLYLTIDYVIYSIIVCCNDGSEALFVIKMLTYIFCYVYVCNAFKNLIKAYPKNVSFRVIYYILRFEFAKALPSYWKPILERLNHEFDKNEEENKNGKL